jgi:hypothetical protein
VTRLPVQEVPVIGEQKAAREKLLASPCPYCSDPKTFQRELTGKGRADHKTQIARVGKFWTRAERGMVLLTSYDHGDYFCIPVGSKHFAPRFKDYHLDIISFPASGRPFFHASQHLLFIVDAAPSDIVRHTKHSLNVARVTNKNSAVIVDAHTWFSHGTILTVHHIPKELSSADITVMQEALEFFRPETRGAPKIKAADVFKTIKALGAGVTQAEAAKRLGVGKSTLGDWLKREGRTWNELKRSYLGG